MVGKSSHDELEDRLTKAENEAKELRTLYRAATAIGSNLSLESTLESVATQIANALDSAGCAILLWHREQNKFENLIDYSKFFPDEVDAKGSTYDLKDYPAMLHVLKTGQTLLVRVDDPKADKAEVALMKEQGIFTSLAVPLKTNKQVLGFCEIYEDVKPREFTAQEIRLVESISYKAAIALENAHLYKDARNEIVKRRAAEEKLKKSHAELSVLSKRNAQVNRILKKLVLGIPLDEILTMILESTEEESPGTIASILLVDSDGKKLFSGVKTRLPDYFVKAIDGTPVKDGMGSCGTAAFRSETTIVENIQTHPYWENVRELTKKAGLSSCWSQPVIDSSENVVGTFALYNNKPKRPGNTELELMESMAQLAAISLENHSTKKEKIMLRKMLENIIDSMPSVLIGFDPDSNVTLWNMKARQETGITHKDAIGKPIDQVFTIMAADMESVHEAMRTHGLYSKARRSIKPNGELAYENITAYPLVTNGLEGGVIRVDDVTEQARLEEMIIQSEKMLSVGGLAAGMAHEINNPLAGVIQNANVLANRLTDTTMPANIKAAESVGISIEKMQKFMEIRNIPRIIKGITDSGERMASIVENMLTFARKNDSSFSSYEPASLMNRILELASTDYDLKKKFDFKSIIIEKDYDENLPMLACKGNEIQQVLLNILNNGAYSMFDKQASEKNYQPKFCLRLSKEKRINALCIEIKDNGLGIDEMIRKRIFEPFFSTKPVGIGTGLGLSVSYFIITRNHKGTIEVESELGKGTNFIIRLPLERKAPKPQ